MLGLSGLSVEAFHKEARFKVNPLPFFKNLFSKAPKTVSRRPTIRGGGVTPRGGRPKVPTPAPSIRRPGPASPAEIARAKDLAKIQANSTITLPKPGRLANAKEGLGKFLQETKKSVGDTIATPFKLGKDLLKRKWVAGPLASVGGIYYYNGKRIDAETAQLHYEAGGHAAKLLPEDTTVPGIDPVSQVTKKLTGAGPAGGVLPDTSGPLQNTGGVLGGGLGGLLGYSLLGAPGALLGAVGGGALGFSKARDAFGTTGSSEALQQVAQTPPIPTPPIPTPPIPIPPTV
jgi:hypothetical protein